MPANLVSCSSIGTHCIQRNDECRIVVIDGIVIKFTPTQYRLLVLLLEGQPVADAQLLRATLTGNINSPISNYKVLEKHIEKIRSKLCLHGLTIHRIAKYGYLLLADAC